MPRMRSYIFFLLLFFHFSIATTTTSIAQDLSARVPAPTTTFTAESLQPTNLQHFRGKVVVLNLWTAWCGPCRQEIPALQRLAKKLPAEKFAVVAVNQDADGASAARPFLEKLGVKELPIYLDPKGRLSKDLVVQAFPSSFVIEANGTLVARLEGTVDWDRDDVVEYLSKLIGH